jgi:hypothetical protein
LSIPVKSGAVAPLFQREKRILALTTVAHLHLTFTRVFAPDKRPSLSGAP